MKKIKLSTNVAVFLLFFGAALVEAIQSANWGGTAFWAGIGLVFLLADNLKRA